MPTIAALILAAGLTLLGLSAPRAEIVVGFVTGLSGPLSSIGVPNSKGFAAGLAYQGEVGGETIRVVQLDDASDPATSARNARKLVEQERVDLLIGSAGAPQTYAMATAAIEMKVPMIAVSPITPPPAGEGGPWVVQTPQPQALLVEAIVRHMKAASVKSVGFIGFGDAFGDLIYDSLAKSAGEAGIRVVANERYARTDTSVSAQVLKTVAARPDAVVVGGTATPGALPVLGLKERGYKGLVYGNNGMMSADFLRLAGAAAEGIVCPTGPVIVAEQLPEANPIRKVALDYRAAYARANGVAPTDGFAPYTFDGWVIFLDAAKRALATGAKPGTPAFKAALREALFASREVAGTHAIYTFTPASSYGVDERARVLIRYEGAGWKLLPDPPR